LFVLKKKKKKKKKSILVVRPRTIIHKALVQPRLLTIFRFFHEQKVFTVDGG